MATTKDFRKLKGKVSAPTDANGKPLEGTVTKTGLLKTSAGLVIPPSTFNDNSSHSGAYVPLTAEERGQFPQLDTNIGQGSVGKDAAQAATAAPAKPSRKRSSARKQAPAEQDTVTVGIVLENAGKIPAQYAHVYRGQGLLVLGMCAMSYEPQRLTVQDGSYGGVFELEQYPGERYGYTGNEFTDKDGVRNILAFRIPEKNKEAKDVDGQKRK